MLQLSFTKLCTQFQLSHTNYNHKLKFTNFDCKLRTLICNIPFSIFIYILFFYICIQLGLSTLLYHFIFTTLLDLHLILIILIFYNLFFFFHLFKRPNISIDTCILISNYTLTLIFPTINQLN
jgi:hypothetical protein